MTDSKITVIRKLNNITHSISGYSDTTINSINSETKSSNSVSDDSEDEIDFNKTSSDEKSSKGNPLSHDKLKTSLNDILNKSDKKRDRKTKKSEKQKLYILEIIILETSVLKFNKKIHKPRIRISIFDISSGKLLTKKKENPKKTENNSVGTEIKSNFLTSPGNIAESTSFSFRWPLNTIVVFDEEIEYLKLKNFIIFFELIDNSNTKSPNDWYHIAWSFLRPPTDINDVIIYKQKSIQMQLFQYQQKLSKFDSIFSEYIKRKRTKYSAVLKILINCKETTNKNINSCDSPIVKKLDNENSSIGDGVTDLNWHGILIKLENRTFQIPEKEIFRNCDLEKGCSITSFSSDFSLLAFTEIHCNFSTIVIFDFYKMEKILQLNGHEGIVHNLKWMKGCSDDGSKILLSSSEDKTCIVWKILEKSYFILNVLYHPTFVYAATFVEDNLFKKFSGIASGARDGVLRLWNINDKKDNFLLKQEINEHKSYIIVIEFNKRTNRLYTGENSGLIIEWKFEKYNWILRRKLTTNKKLLRDFIICPVLHRLYVLTTEELFTIELSSGYQNILIGDICFNDGPTKLTISKCGDYIFIGFRRKIICWSEKLKKILKEYQFNGNINSIDFNSELNLLTIGTTGRNGGIVIYGPENFFTIKNITKNFQETKHKNIYSMSTNSQFNLILDKLDNLFNFEWSENERLEKILKPKIDKVITEKNKKSSDSQTATDDENFTNRTFSVKINKTYSISDEDFGKTFSVKEINKSDRSDDSSNSNTKKE